MNFTRTFSLIALCCACSSAFGQSVKKVLPKHATPPPTAAVSKLPARAAGESPFVVSLSGVKNKAVSLHWNNPEPVNGLFDDFEDHTDFTVNSPGAIGWQYVDADNRPTYTWSAADFPNQGARMAYIVFNPSMTSPSTGNWPDMKPYSGQKMLACFTVDKGNNDYIISPELSFDTDFQLSFVARSYNDAYGLERFRVGYSTTGSRPSDFTFLGESAYTEAPTHWQRYTYTIPREARYVTINCVSAEAFIFLLDDIYIGTNVISRSAATTKATTPDHLVGFNLLRNGQQLNTSLLTERAITDTVPDYGTYNYTVEGINTDGSKRYVTPTLSVEVPDVRLLPFEDDFHTGTLDAERWITPVDAAGQANHWNCDYYPYGLVDWSACFSYTKLLPNYSQELRTTELRTLTPAATHLRYEIRLDNGMNCKNGHLAVEISTDGGATWKVINDLSNDEGSFTWRRFDHAIGDVLGDAQLFQVRFRVYGDDAFYINYWYVDDVKVWNPTLRPLQMVVTNGKGAPVSGANITCTATHGAIYEATTDAQGHVDWPAIEIGDYAVTIKAAGYNQLTTNVNILTTSAAQVPLRLTAPTATWNTTSIQEDLEAETSAHHTLQLTNAGDGELSWRLSPTPTAGTGDASERFTPGMAFDASGDVQSSVAFDGEHFYTTSWLFLGQFFEYDRDGRFIEAFSVPGMYYKLYDLAFDGTYFYGSDLSSTIFQLDLAHRRLVKQWKVKSQEKLEISHISYDPRNDEFWIGDFTRLARVDREGNLTVDLHEVSPGATSDIGIFGSAFDDVSEGGPYLWFSNLTPEGVNSIDNVQLAQYDLNQRRLTGVTHAAIDVPGYKTGSLTTGSNNLGGIELTTRLHPGELTLVGALQQSPARIFTYRMATFDNWYTAEPLAGTLRAGETQDINVTLDAARTPVGTSVQTTMNLFTLPELADAKDVTLGMNVTRAASAPRPTDLTATVDEDACSVQLQWQTVAGATPTGYTVLRDSTEVAHTTEPNFVDTNLLRGTYAYTVKAHYAGDRTSIASEAAEVEVKVGKPYFPPTGLQASLSRNKDVQLEWHTPDALLHEPATLRWDSNTNDEAFGMSAAGYFYAGIAFSADDLQPYRGMTLSAIDAFIKEQCTSLSIKIYKDNKLLLTQRINSADIQYGEFTTFALQKPVIIERGSDYRIALLIAHEAGVSPLGIHVGKTREGKSNLISLNGTEWFPVSYVGCTDTNFNLGIHLTPTADYAETQPSAYRVMRNGEDVATVTATQFAETLTEPGTYAYTVRAIYADQQTSTTSDTAKVEVIHLGTPMAPRTLNAQLSHGKNVALRWNLPLDVTPSVNVDMDCTLGSSPAGRPEYVSQFRGVSTGEMGIASDGNYFYTTRHAAPGIINRYDMKGNFEESFRVSEYLTEGFRNLTFDGKHFYASANGSSIYQVDMDAQTLADTINISEIARHLTYVPTLDEGAGGFEVGDWETSIYVTRKGAKVGNGPTFKGASGTAYYAGTLYSLEQGYEKPYELCARKASDGTMLWHTSLAAWQPINPASGASAGGLSVLHTAEGLDLLCVALQESAGTRFFLLDLGCVKGLAGYNVYRNGTLLNDSLLSERRFDEVVTEPGTYDYQVQTVYVDDTKSALSDPVTITVLPMVAGEQPTDIKARMTSVGYDVNISVVDPSTLHAKQYESFEGTTTDATTSQMTLAAGEGFEGANAMRAEAETEGWVIVPVKTTFDDDFLFSFTARQSNASAGVSSVEMRASNGSNTTSDFVFLREVNLDEAWRTFTTTVPKDTRYVALHLTYSYDARLVDAISLNDQPLGDIVSYDLMRADSIVAETVPATASLTDHNLLPGSYDYRVRPHFDNGAMGEWTDPVHIDVNYDNGHQAPGTLTVSQTPEANTLQWSMPALSAVQPLRWHNGVSSGSAGMPNGGAYYAGVQWTAAELAPYAALSVAEISFYVNQVPDVVFVQLFQGGDLVFEKYVNGLHQSAFNTVRLDQPIAINSNKDMRAVVYVEHNSITVPLGYDAGPAISGKGDLYSSDGVNWSTLKANDIDANWNITLGLQAYASAPMAAPAALRGTQKERVFPARALQQTASTTTGLTTARFDAPQAAESTYFAGYNVYCNGVCLNPTPLAPTAVSYTDDQPHTGRYYEYQVKAIYPNFGEVGSNVVRVMSTGIDAVTTDDATAPTDAYDISGIKANSRTRGVIIKDGKKVINRP